MKEYIIDKRDSSIIVILSDNISLDILSPIVLPQIYAVYNDKLVRLYCLPEMVSSVDQYIKKISKRSCSSYILSIIRKNRFLIGTVISICLAYLFPNVGKTGGYIRSEWSIKWGCIIFLSGLFLRTNQLAKEFLHIRLHATIQIYNLFIILFIIYGFMLLLSITSMNKTLIIGIIIMGSSSTTISSNVVMTKNALGNEHAALLNAVLGNLLSIFISPAMILYFMKNSIFDSLSNRKNNKDQLDYGHVIKNLSLTVLLPLVIGQIIHLLWTKQVTYIRDKFYLAEINNLAVLTLIWSVFCTAFANRSFQKIDTKDLFILIIIDAGIYMIFSLLIMIIARLPIRH